MSLNELSIYALVLYVPGCLLEICHFGTLSIHRFSYPTLWHMNLLAVLLATNAGPFDPCGLKTSDKRILLPCHVPAHYELLSQFVRLPRAFVMELSCFRLHHPRPMITNFCETLSDSASKNT